MADWLQGHFGAVPMTLLSWVRVAGNAWLAGAPHPQWPGSASADPLVIEVEGARYPGGPIREHYEHEYDTWRERSAQDRRAGVLMLSLAPDRLHKENTSGGPALRDGASRRLRRRPGRRRDDHAVRVYLTRQAARRATSRPVTFLRCTGREHQAASPPYSRPPRRTPPRHPSSRHERAFSAQAFMHNYAGRSIARR
jgi:hypothetical protein